MADTLLTLRSAFRIPHSPFRSRRVPVLLQMNATECGAACLAMILSYYGRKTAIAACRAAFEAGRDGITARMIVQAAREQGLRVKTFSAELDQVAHLPLPAIVHWNFNHFVVLEQWAPGKVRIVDPALGRRTLSGAEFAQSFT